MADKPIIFSAPMVRALLDGTKTQTRRAFKPQPDALPNGFASLRLSYNIGDRLWVREAVTWVSAWGWRYRADNDDLTEKREAGEVGKWAPSIHMPRHASRLTLTVTDVRVQRLQEISLGDICAEGLARSIYDFAPVQRGFDAFDALWDSIHGKGAAVANPWVAAYTFTVQRGNIDQMPGVADG